MQKVVIHARVPQWVKDAVEEQAKENAITASNHIGKVLEKHVTKQEGKPVEKKEYGK